MRRQGQAPTLGASPDGGVIGGQIMAFGKPDARRSGMRFALLMGGDGVAIGSASDLTLKTLNHCLHRVATEAVGGAPAQRRRSREIG